MALIAISCLSSSITNIFGAGISAKTNDLYLVVQAVTSTNGMTAITNEPIQFDDRLVWMTFCETGEVELRLDSAHCIKMSMTDSNGNDIQQTALGQKFGFLFDQLKVFSDIKRPAPTMATGAYKDNWELGGGHLLPTPEQLFKIRKPGIYTLVVQIQVFEVFKNTSPWTRNLIRFSPVKIKIEKPSVVNKGVIKGVAH